MRGKNKAAHQAGISATTLGRWISRGQIKPYRKVSPRIVIYDLDRIKKLAQDMGITE